MSEQPQSCDLAIIGGGLVGASLALALDQLGLSVVLLEATPVGAIGQPSFDDRTTAVSNGSRRIFEALGVWPLIEHEATPIRRIHVSDQGRFGFARLSAEEQGLKALGHVITNRAMGAALWQRLSRTGVRTIAPARVTSMRVQDRVQLIRYLDANDGEHEISSRLVVAADGARSIAREAGGVQAQSWNYEQVALVSNVLTQRFHEHIAYERFTPSGPIALLPLSDGRMGLIWTFTPQVAEAMAQSTDAEFLSRLQSEFGYRLGRFTRVGARQLYPLTLTRSDEHVAERLAIVGNAAQALHPIAGQGFNLGLRDAVSLAEVLADAQAEVPQGFDPGDGLWLQRYAQWREGDRSNIVRFTDGLVRLFNQPFGPAKLLRDVGMLAFDLMPSAKEALAQLSLGAAAKIPRLARGAPLKHAN